MTVLLRFFLMIMPWVIRRPLLQWLFGYRLHPGSHIGLAWAYPKHLEMDDGSSIGHLTVCVHLDRISLGRNATIGRGNWITGFPSGTSSSYFNHQTDRQSSLVVAEQAAITNRHLIDCTSPVKIGRFSTVAGFASQILTHSIDLKANRQSSAPVTIGEYCFIGTNCVILGGATLPDWSALGAKSLLNRSLNQTYTLYGGVPARELKRLAEDLGYFKRTSGVVE